MLLFAESTGKNKPTVAGYVAFHAALRRAFDQFVRDLTNRCKELVMHHLDALTSPFSHIRGFQNGIKVGLGALEGSRDGANKTILDAFNQDIENVAPLSVLQSVGGAFTTPARKSDTIKEPLRESQYTVPETPSPEQAVDSCNIKRKEYALVSGRLGAENCSKKRQGSDSISELDGHKLGQPKEARYGSNPGGTEKTRTAYSQVCTLAAEHFAQIREVLVERSVPSTLNAGFLTPWYGLSSTE